jgi:hypothetical protein
MLLFIILDSNHRLYHQENLSGSVAVGGSIGTTPSMALVYGCIGEGKFCLYNKNCCNYHCDLSSGGGGAGKCGPMF